MTSFTVVIPTLSHRRLLLDRAVASTLAQTLRPEEIVIVGADHLPDIEVYKENAKGVNLKSIRGVDKLNASQARNLGATVSSSDWLSFLDDDDYWDSNYLQYVGIKVENSKADAVLATLYAMNLEGGSKRLSRPFVARDLYLANPGVTGSNTSVRREVFEALGGFSVELAVSQDKALILELLKRNYTLAFAEEAIAINCEHTLPRLTDPTSQLKGYAEFYRRYRNEMPIVTKIRFLKKIISFCRVNAKKITKRPPK